MRINNLFTTKWWVPCTILLVFASSCVSTQKYNEMVTARDHYKAQSESSGAAETEMEECERKLRVAENQLRKVNQILAQEKLAKVKIAEAKAELENRYDKTATENEKLLTEYSTNKSTLEEQLANVEDELYLRDRQLDGMEQQIGSQGYDLQSREERVAELERMLAEKDAQMANMRISLDNALRGFDDSELSVNERNGNIYVTMSHQLLFAKGSSVPDADGQNAIRQLARALTSNPDIDIIVEGHTDNSGAVDYNLKLSSDRAVEVAKLLAINGVMPYRITAAGKGMHHPIVPNTDAEGKTMNRRTEVVLSPNLDKLYEMSK